MRSKINNNKIYIRYHDVTVFLHFISHEDLSRVMVGSVLLNAWWNIVSFGLSANFHWIKISAFLLFFFSSWGNIIFLSASFPVEGHRISFLENRKTNFPPGKMNAGWRRQLRAGRGRKDGGAGVQEENSGEGTDEKRMCPLLSRSLILYQLSRYICHVLAGRSPDDKTRVNLAWQQHSAVSLWWCQMLPYH